MGNPSWVQRLMRSARLRNGANPPRQVPRCGSGRWHVSCPRCGLEVHSVGYCLHEQLAKVAALEDRLASAEKVVRAAMADRDWHTKARAHLALYPDAARETE